MSLRTVLAAVVAAALVFGILGIISIINDKIRDPEEETTIIEVTAEEVTTNDSYEDYDWWTEKVEVAKADIKAFKAKLSKFLESDNFTSAEAKKLVKGLAEASLDVERDNFYLSEEEWKCILDFEEKINFDGDSEVKLSDHLNFIAVDDYQLMYIEVVNDSGESVDHWNLSWD